MKTLRLATLLGTIPLLSFFTHAQTPGAPSTPPLFQARGGNDAAEVIDTIYIHGDILTGAHLRASDPSTTPARVAAVAVSRGRVLAVGSDAEMLKLKAASTKVMDLNGAFAMPGFNDAHTHMASAGQQHLTVDLVGTVSLAEMQSRIRAYVADPAISANPSSWIKGGGWDHTLWVGKKLPSKADLDSVTSKHPAVFERVDGHILVANSAALAAAQITAATPSPQAVRSTTTPQASPPASCAKTRP